MDEARPHDEYRHRRIVSHYLRTWFLVDFLAILPFNLLNIFFEGEEFRKMKVIKMVRLLRLLKLMKVLKASRVLRRVEASMEITYHRLTLCKFMVLIGMISHWLACIWAMTLTLVDKEGGTPTWVDGFEGHDAVDTVEKLYIAALYFTSYTLTSVGYGDIGPKNITERVICTVIIFVSGISWAYVLGQFCGTVASMNAREDEFRTVMNDLNIMMRDRDLPKPMRHRLRGFFLSTKSVQRHHKQLEVLQRMSPDLQGEVKLQLNHGWLKRICFMKGLLTEEDSIGRARGVDQRAPAYIVDTAMALGSAFYSQSEIFGKPLCLYILQRGLTARDKQLRRSGSVWGEDFVLSDSRLRLPARSFALTYVEVAYLERNEFMKIVERHRLAYPELATTVHCFRVRLAAQRGILAEAKRRGAGVRPSVAWAVSEESPATEAPSEIEGLSQQVSSLQQGMIDLRQLVKEALVAKTATTLSPPGSWGGMAPP